MVGMGPPAHHEQVFRVRAAFVALALLVTIFSGKARPSFAAEEMPGYGGMDGCQGSWQRQFAVDILILDCAPGYATAHDRAYMYARGAVDPSADWHSQIDFTNTVWVFDVGARGKASLIVDFHREGNALVAELFDDLLGEGEVRYGLERGYPRSVVSRFPTVRVVAPDGWWVRNNRVNYNVTIAVDGQVTVYNGSEGVLAGVMPNDGHVDATIEVLDPTGSGRPQKEIVQVTPLVSDAWGIYRTVVIANEANDERPISDYILWPYLGYIGELQPPPPAPLRPSLASIPGASYGVVKPPNTSYGPIQIDWANGRITTVAEFVASRGGAHNWFIYSVTRLGQGGQTAANFENPFAFYDLAGRNDGYPDLAVRQEFYPPGDPYGPVISSGALNEIRYSWDHDHQHRWSFKMDFFGRRPVPATVEVAPNFAVQTVPYAEFPRWVIGQQWEAQTFVAAEKRYWTSEGLYEWCAACDPKMLAYYTGLVARKRTEAYGNIREGSRGEYSTDPREPPRLYMSSVDRKLHMYGAESGVWNIADPVEGERGSPTTGTHERINYRALSGSYIDQWERTTEGIVHQTLTHLGDRLIFADANGVTMAAGPSAAALYFTRPPTDPAEWQDFAAKLDTVEPLSDPTDLRLVFDQFTRERLDLPGVSIWDLRPEGAGFRFMALIPAPAPQINNVPGLAPGLAVGAYRPGAGLSFRPAKPGRLSIGAPQLRGDAMAELTATRLVVELTNEGDEDAADVPVVFVGTRGQQSAQTIAWARADVPAGGRATAEVYWSPQAAGEWELSVGLPQHNATSPQGTVVQVAAAPSADVGSILLIQGLHPLAGGAITASLTLAAAVATGFGFVIWRNAGRVRQPPV